MQNTWAIKSVGSGCVKDPKISSKMTPVTSLYTSIPFGNMSKNVYDLSVSLTFDHLVSSAVSY